MEIHEMLEQEVAAWAGYDPGHVVACSSGTAALHLAFEALKLSPGAPVIVPTYTMVACARAVTLAQLQPVFLDCGEDLLLDSSLAESYCRAPREKHLEVQAVMAVHVYGRACDMAPILNAAADHRAHGQQLYVIEDLAEAHGLSPHKGTDAACWSFYKNKVVAGQEGGAVAFRDKAHADLARQLRCLGFTEAHDFTHIPRGCNYRLSDANAALILRSLGHYSASIARRRAFEWEYERHCPSEWRLPPRDVPWVYDVRIPGLSGGKQTQLVKALRTRGIEARHGFKPLHMQEEYRNGSTLIVRGTDRVSERLASEILYLPLDPKLVKRGDAERSFALLRELVYGSIVVGDTGTVPSA